MSSAAETKLPENVERLLADMPVAERDWEAMASTIVERAMAAGESSSELLLNPPLPCEEGEPGFERKPAPSKAAPVSLADLARASVKKKNESAKDIALESLAVASQARAQVDEIAERVQAAARQTRASVPEVEEAKPVSEPPVAKVEEEARPRAVATVPPAARPQRVSRGPWIVSGFAVLAAAAAIAISLRPKSEPPPLVTNTVTEQPKQVAQQQPAAAPAAKTPEPAEHATPEAVATLPPLEQRPATGPAPATKSGASAPPAPSGVKPEAIVLEDEEPAPSPAQAPAPSPSPKMVPAELPRTGLPDKPSAGAAYAAIGPFMGSARACVAGHEEASTARIVFVSDGTVQSVSVSGPAAGTAAAGCIENAFKKARVQPFAAPTFSMSAPVRPQ